MGTAKRERQKALRDAQRAQAQALARRRRNIRIAGIFAVVVLIAIFVVVIVGNGDKSSDSASDTTASSTASSDAATSTTAAPTTTPAIAPTCPEADGSSPKSLNFTGAPSGTCLPAGTKATATFTTSKGTVVVDLDTTNTPKTADNFAFLSGWHYYDGTKLFRVDTSIDIIQGGSPHTEDASDPGPGYTIKDEGKFATDAGGNVTGPYTYEPGDLVMARSSGPDSAAAQFFFVTGSNGAQLDSQGSYVVFGHVTSGLDVLQAIASGPTTPLSNGLGATPNPPVTITSVKITQS